MRISVILLSAACLITLPAQAQVTGTQDASLAPPQSRLDTLYSELKRERNERAAQRIANRIRAEWAKSGSATIDLMMGWIDEAVKARKYPVALDLLDEVVLLEPSFAEGWNRRATVHFMMDSYVKSMSDIQQVLTLEPRHFGALSGMAAVFKSSDRKQAAMNAYARILDVYPMLRSAQDEIGRLAEELAGESI